MPQLQVILNLPIVGCALRWRGGCLLFLASRRCLRHAEALLQKPPHQAAARAVQWGPALRWTRHSGGTLHSGGPGTQVGPYTQVGPALRWAQHSNGVLALRWDLTLSWTQHSGGDRDRPQGEHLCPGTCAFLRGWGRICLSTSRTRKSTRSGTLTSSNMAKGVSADDEGTLHQSQNNRHPLHPLRTNILELPVCEESSHSCSLQQLQRVQQLQRAQHSEQPGEDPEGRCPG